MTRSEPEASDILARVRNGDSPEDVLRHIEKADLLLQLRLVPDVHHQYTFPYMRSIPTFLLRQGNPYLDSWLYKCSSFGEHRSNVDKVPSKPSLDRYYMPYHAVEIIDPRLTNISAKKWTVVTGDDKLVRKLLQTFFLTEYSWYPTFHKDHFLEDMAHGRPRFCSSLLVNAILASACVSPIQSSKCLLIDFT